MTDAMMICPQCGVEMQFRLGEWECPACFFTTSATQPEVKPTVRGSRYANIGNSLNNQDGGVARGKRDSYRPTYRS